MNKSTIKPLTEKKTVTRRSFLQRSTSAALGLSAWTALSADRVIGANDRVNVALIGCGGRGSFILRVMIADAGANCVCLCDLSDKRLDKMWSFIEPVQPNKPRFEKDYRKVLESPDIDAVIVATHDNWHAPLTIMACQAGKDVYVEKPHSFCMWESGLMVEAAAKYKRIVQVGTQNRSADYVHQAREIVQSGKLGKIGLVKVFNLKNGSPFKLGEPGTQPADFNWDRWLGRAALRPYHQRIWQGGWHKNWDYCGGDLTDDSIHQLDLALMVMGDPGLPTSVRALGGQYVVHKEDDAEVPDVLNVAWDFGSFVMAFDMSQYPSYMAKTTDELRKSKNRVPDWTLNATRIEIYGQDLLMILGRHGGGLSLVKASNQIVDKIYGQPPDLEHYLNFITCVKSRKQPNADIAIAHASNLTAHMGNIAHRIGNVSMNYDAKTSTFDNPAANAMFKATYRKGYEISDKV
ncbi:MAG: Gfo/Idh/MocA family oxidoreductase [Kiritimatiellia bacterium]